MGIQAPHPPLGQYYGAGKNRPEWVRGIFNRTAADYDRMEAAMAFGSGSRYRRTELLAAGLRPGMRVVDVGVGTGLVAREAAAIVGDPNLVTGVDPSTGMVANAIVPAGVHMLAGMAESIPLPDASVDFLSMGYALRHISDLGAAYEEFSRVLRPGGLLCVLEITLPRGRLSKALLKGYIRGVGPLLARVVARHKDTAELLRYYWDTIETCVAPEVVVQGVRQAGFAAVSHHVQLGIFSAYRARRRLD